jgi:hypothetical protein
MYFFAISPLMKTIVDIVIVWTISKALIVTTLISKYNLGISIVVLWAAQA